MSSIVVIADLQGPEVRQDITRALDSDFWPQLEARYPTVTRRAIGEAEGQAEFMNQLLMLMLLAFGGIYFLLAVTFRSYAQPAMILCVIPFSFFGAMVGHFIFGTSFALFSWLGMIAAIGVVVNDNVVLVDRANQIRGYFALRRKSSVHMPALPEGSGEVTEVVAANGQTWELVKIAEDFELHEDFVREAIDSDLQRGPLEMRFSNQMQWEKSEYREHAQDLEDAGFQVVRVKADRGIAEASVSRFRQIFLTSVTEFVGLAPMLLEQAALVQFLKPMATSLAFGVLLCMPATLLLTPAFYMIGVDIKKGVTSAIRFWVRLAEGRPRVAPAE